ncbi:MAG: hypothetical protein LC689_18200, partial [Myxococcales bacterium]|nr:hypothetical protein [Myxococcales bacterium]
PWYPPTSVGVPQAGTSQLLGSGGSTVMNRVTYRNFGDHESFLVTHSADVQGVTGIRWYELRLGSDGNPSVYQQGTYAPDADHRLMPSAAMDRMGDVAIGYNVSSSSIHPDIRVTGRLATDSPGLMTAAETILHAGAFSQTSGPRWGDYSSMQVDPIDDCTFWFTTQFAGEFGPGTRIAAFRMPGCVPPDPFAIVVDPPRLQLVAGQSATFHLGASVLSGAPEPLQIHVDGLPAGVTASLGQPLISGDSTTLIVSAASSAPMTAAAPISILATSATFQAGAVAAVDVSAPAPGKKASTGSGCQSAAGSITGMLLVLAVYLDRRARRRSGL